MSILAAFRLALKSVQRNLLRSTLTTLGITIGIAAVICTVALGNGKAEQVRLQLREMGDDFIWIEAGGRNVGGVRTGSGASPTLNVDDMFAIQNSVRRLKACSPQVDSRVQVVFHNQNWSTTYRGVSPEFLQVRRLSVDGGTMFSNQDVDGRANVCLLGRTVVGVLFGEQEPIGQVIRVHNLPFRVIGVLRAKAASSTGTDQDDTTT